MRHPPSRMTARRRSYRLAGPPPSVTDLLSPPLLPYPRVHAPPATPAVPCAALSVGKGIGTAKRAGFARAACRRHAGKRRA
ncbi:hypothetical protein [Cupriavidus necator]|uniref:hypothetical protein n=1 Tax=Cupriavidus necator TaxID=106590 RepID=UPI000AA8A258|nr:hypothetical protein [Cupriavidus necator]